MPRPISRYKEAQLDRLLHRVDKDAEHYETLRAWMLDHGWDLDDPGYQAVNRAVAGLADLRRMVRWEIDERHGRHSEPVKRRGAFHGGMP